MIIEYLNESQQSDSPQGVLQISPSNESEAFELGSIFATITSGENGKTVWKYKTSIRIPLFGANEPRLPDLENAFGMQSLTEKDKKG
jgi:hypothetical protein